jgi:aspartyl-tRNA(Asn)/glutamyl-tRNA(Gln) amidotransferase subunit A
MDCMTEPNLLSVYEALHQMRAGRLSPRTLTEACFHQIERLNPKLNAFITVCDGVLESEDKTSQTKQVAYRLDVAASGTGAALPGIPLGIKDLFETKGIRTTAGSKFFTNYIPADDAVVVRKLKEAGATIMGKTNTHEIALGVTTSNPFFGICRNPWALDRIPGGSSGGSAVAVVTGMALAALGTDTGGSIRIPASLCGVTGLKPTFGRVSVRGVFPLSWNLDHVGPLTRTVTDAAIILQVIAGYDPEDPFSINTAVDDFSVDIENGVKDWRVALGVGEYIEDADPEILAAVHQAALIFENSGANVEEVEVSFLHAAALANSLMTPADGAAYHHQRLADHPDWFGADVRRRLETGRSLTSTEYIMARRTQSEIRHRLAGFFEEYDLLLLPSTPIAAPLIEGNDAVEQARRLTRFTAPFNLAGLPALSIPCGYTKSGLPIGLQIVSRAWNEAGVLEAARAYERETDWNAPRPAICQA